MKRLFERLRRIGQPVSPDDSEPQVEGSEHTTSVTVAVRGSSAGDGGGLLRRAAGHLTVIDGPAPLLSKRFAIRDDEVSIGRAETCYVAIADERISRVHAQVVREGDRLVLVHRSGTNQTFLNGKPVADRAALSDGDEIQLADCVALRLDAPGLRRDPRSRASFGLREAMEARVALEDRIASEFVRDGSFLDVDVVDSHRLKVDEQRPECVVVSFERFRAFIEGTVESHAGQVLNSNGDEVMAYFESADTALDGAQAILAALPEWNARENRLGSAFRVRIGIHTGRSVVDLERGVAYSPVLDGAGHLQKAAPVNGILISSATYELLGRREGLTSLGVVTRDGIEAYGRAEPPGR
jgi:class 3 adenylate cyclase